MQQTSIQPTLDDARASGALAPAPLALVVQQPNFFGLLEEVDALTDRAHARDALVIAVANPLSLAVLKAPGRWGGAGADIACGDGQPFGIPMSSGGPSFGYFCCRAALVRQMPGRIIGRTVDLEGRVGYTLTLQAREQHIRRSKAKSNICSNHQLTAIMATINMAAMGPEGLREQAIASITASHDLASRLKAAGLEPDESQPYFTEFLLPVKRPAAEVRRELADRGVLAGVPAGSEFGNALLLTATEITTEEERQQLADLLAEIEAVK